MPQWVYRLRQRDWLSMFNFSVAIKLAEIYISLFDIIVAQGNNSLEIAYIEYLLDGFTWEPIMSKPKVCTCCFRDRTLWSNTEIVFRLLQFVIVCSRREPSPTIDQHFQIQVLFNMRNVLLFKCCANTGRSSSLSVGEWFPFQVLCCVPQNQLNFGFNSEKRQIFLVILQVLRRKKLKSTFTMKRSCHHHYEGINVFSSVGDFLIMVGWGQTDNH